MVTKEMTSMDIKGQPGMAPAVSPLQYLQSLDPFHKFSIPPPPRHEMAKGVIHIYSVSGQDKSVEADKAGNRTDMIVISIRTWVA
jgi:hypothetical protein